MRPLPLAAQQPAWVHWWLYLALFFEYARPANFAPVLAVLPLNAIIPVGLLVVCLVMKGMRPFGEIFRDPLAKWVLIYLIMIPISGLGADTITYSINVFNRVLGYVFFWIMICRVVVNWGQVRGLMLTLVVAHLFLIAMNPKILLDPSQRHYISGGTFLGDGNDFSLSLCILIPFALELALRANSKLMKIVYWASLVVIILAIVGTSSRGATLGMGSLFVYLWWRSEKKAIGLVGVMIALIGVLVYAPDIYFQRMGTLRDAENEGSAAGRMVAWNAGTKMALDNPVMGVGAGNFPNNFPKYRPPDGPRQWLTAHSMYFLVLGELGFPGLIVILVLVFGNMRALRRVAAMVIDGRSSTLPAEAARQLERKLFLLSSATVGFAVAGAFLSVSYYPHLFILNALYLAARSITIRDAGLDANAALGKSATKRAVRRTKPPSGANGARAKV
jgi:putative inorganic carbon (HCO3(-)) transporter